MATKKVNEAESVEKEIKVKKTKSVSKKAKDKEGFPAHEVEHLIATEAYYLAEKRGFAPGGEMEDWLTAECLVRSYFI